MEQKLERIARALESIAESLHKIATPAVKVVEQPVDLDARATLGEWHRIVTEPPRELRLGPESNRRMNCTWDSDVGPHIFPPLIRD
jgi:hypothetical protein